MTAFAAAMIGADAIADLERRLSGVLGAEHVRYDAWRSPSTQPTRLRCAVAAQI